MDLGPGLQLAALLIALFGLGLAALAAAADSAYTLADRVRLRESTGQHRAVALERLLNAPAATAAVIQGLRVVGLAASTAAFAWVLAASATPVIRGPQLLAWAGWGLAALTLATYLPRAAAERDPEATALNLAPVMGVLALVAGLPLTVVARLSGYWPEPPARPIREDELRSLLDIDAETGDSSIEEDEIEMMAGVMEMGDTMVREIMVPRIDIVAIPADATIDQALDKVIAAGHSRIPAYRESIDDVVGLLYAKDLLAILRNAGHDRQATIAGHLRAPHVVPESMPVKNLLAGLRSAKVHMAIVVDEYGGTAGLVTIEDLLEQIVGDIQDEYDEEVPDVELLEPGTGIFSGGLNIDQLNRLMDIDLPTTDADTLGGLVLSHLGRVPLSGERVAFPDADLEVLSLAGRRVARVRVSRLPAAAAPDPDA